MDRTSPPLNAQILEQASDWFVEFSEGTLDPQAREQFDNWLRRSPEHVQAYLKITTLWEDAPLLGTTRVLPSDELVARVLAEGNIVPLPSTPSAGSPSGVEPPPVAEVTTLNPPGEPPPFSSDRPTQRKHRPRGRIWAAAATILITCAAGAWLYIQQGTYATAIGEQRSVRLEDGSTLDLNSHSRVRIRFNSRQRNVELLEGQALFRVAKDASRPFVVATDNTRVRAIGTQFDVNRKNDGTVVTVLEGRVAVISAGVSPPPPRAEDLPPRAIPDGTELRLLTPAQKHSLSSADQGSAASPDRPPRAAPQAEILLAAGEQLTVTPQSVSPPTAADLPLTTAWTQRKIAFKAAPLSEVVEEFNRYNTRQLVIVDPELRSLHISGVFSSTDPDSLLRFLRALPNIDVQETHAEFRISRK